MGGIPDTIPHRLLGHARTRPSSPAYYAKVGGRWQPTSYRRYVEECRTAGRALMALGFARNAKVSILGFNRPEWVIFNHGAMMAGGAAAGIYTTCSPDEVAYIVDHSESGPRRGSRAVREGRRAARQAPAPEMDRHDARRAGDR
jgi:long-chain acyl-CoA synthetase